MSFENDFEKKLKLKFKKNVLEGINENVSKSENKVNINIIRRNQELKQYH